MPGFAFSMSAVLFPYFFAIIEKFSPALTACFVPPEDACAGPAEEGCEAWAAAEAAGLPVLRLVRQPDGGELCRRAKDMAGAADMLEQMPGHVLLTTGSKELHHFARPGLAERCYPRVLPMADSLERCLTLGFPPKNIICMQGPFSRELNVALLRQYHIQTLVTKDTGGYGGFREKAEAAREAGCALLVVERPRRETGLTLEEIQKKLMEEENA